MWEGGPDYDGRAGGGVVVMTLRRLAPLDDRTGLRAVDAHRLEHLRRQNLPLAALQRQPAVAEAAIGRPARTLGAQVQQPADAVPKLREQEAAAVPDVGIVHAELMPMIAQRQRLGQRSLQRLEPAEMRQPLLIAQVAEAHRFRPSVIAETQDGSEEHTTELQSLMR